jgi:hypothetical protein
VAGGVGFDGRENLRVTGESADSFEVLSERAKADFTESGAESDFFVGDDTVHAKPK